MRKNLVQAVILATLCAVAGAGGFWLYHRLAQPTVLDKPGGQAPEITINDLNGQPQKLSQWRGRLLLVNFWATWCAPCRHEIPMLIQFQQQYAGRGLQIVGPAMDDLEAVRNDAPQMGINYPVLVGNSEITDAMQALGDDLGALPYSVLIAANGEIVARKHGEFEHDELAGLIEQHLPKK